VMLRRLLARRSRRIAPTIAAHSEAQQPQAPARNTSAALEQLEGRVLFALPPHVTSIIADNRGEVVITTQKSLNPATITTRSVFIFNAGPDGIPLTADDTKMAVRPSYVESNRQLRIKVLGGGVPADWTYFVKLSAKFITDYSGMKLDGEFNGPGVRSGNNQPAGDLLFVSKRDRSTRPVARFFTNQGGVNVRLFKDLKPITYSNFVNYANGAHWDGTFFHRSAKTGPQQLPFVVQGGGFIVDRNNTIQNAHQEDSILNEPGISNVRGTVAMARIDDNNPATTDDINSATNQWFFNLGDNSALDSVNGGFTVFGEVADDASMAAIDRISALSRVDADGPGNGPFGEMPVNDLAAVQTRGFLDPAADVVSVRRVGILNKVSALVF
jgi:cyclophilin family peptidyl-prolyl cis-trans isomerase